jgi:hypothetical protein
VCACVQPIGTKQNDICARNVDRREEQINGGVRNTEKSTTKFFLLARSVDPCVGGCNASRVCESYDEEQNKAKLFPLARNVYRRVGSCNASRCVRATTTRSKTTQNIIYPRPKRGSTRRELQCFMVCVRYDNEEQNNAKRDLSLRDTWIDA